MNSFEDATKEEGRRSDGARVRLFRVLKGGAFVVGSHTRGQRVHAFVKVQVQRRPPARIFSRVLLFSRT